MPKHFLHVRSSQLNATSNGPKLPTPDVIEYGELAVNYAQGYETISLKNSNNEIVTISSDLQNDSKFATKTEVGEINTSISNIEGEINNINTSITDINQSINDLGDRIDNVTVDIFRVVTALPSTGIEENVIYLVPSVTTGDSNVYTEHIYVNNQWEELGKVTSSVDLSDYYTKTDADSLFAHSSALTQVDTDIAEIKAYTVNSKAISGNPVLNGSDIQLTGWQEATGTNEELFLAETDTINEAFGKMQKMVGDNEEITSKALNVLNGSCGFNQNGIYEPDNAFLTGTTNLASAIDLLAETVSYLNGHNSLTTTQAIPSTKRLVVVTRDSNDVLTLASNNLPDGKELHIIVHNTGSAEITISMPTSGGFVNLVGDTLTVANGGYGEINIISDGVNKYIRFA